MLVTGGAGFIGGNLVRRLLAEEAVEHVRVLDDLSTGRRENVPPAVELVEQTLLAEGGLAEVVHGMDAVVHLAARPSVPLSIEDPVATWRSNVDGSLRLMEAVRRLARPPHVVVASSSSVYGDAAVLPKAESAASSPRSPYAASKAAMEALVLGHANAFDVSATVFRFFNVFGPLQRADHAYAAVVPAFLAAAVEGRDLPIHGDGTQTRDFTFVDDVADVLTRTVVDGRSAPAPVNLAFGTRTSVLELARMVLEVTGADVDVEHLPARSGDVRDSQADQTRLRELVPGLEPVGLREALRRTWTWFQEEGT